MSNSETTIDAVRREQSRSTATRAMGKAKASSDSAVKAAGGKPSARSRRSPVTAVPGHAGASKQDGAAHWQRMVAEAAYFRAERRGFIGGSPEQDWFEAEVELRGTRDNSSI